MSKQFANLSNFTITQFLNKEYWAKRNIKLEYALFRSDAKFISDWVLELLRGHGVAVEEMHSIIHDKDSRTGFDESMLMDVVELKDKHIHICVKLAKQQNVKTTINDIADMIGIEPQYIEKPRGRYSWDNQLAYLIHAKDIDKHQYGVDEVYTAVGDKYSEIYNRCKSRWEKGRYVKKYKVDKESVDEIEAMILEGRLKRSQVLLTDEYFKVYAKNKKRLDDAFQCFAERKILRATQRLVNGEFSTQVIYVQGASGSGKTQFAKSLIREVVADAKALLNEDWDVCSAASTNPVDDYKGEEILFMDDVRGTTLRADDWLKLLDPYTVSPSSARYSNKTVVARLIVITSVLEPVEFFYYSKGVGSGDAQAEAIDQFLRRLASVVRVIKMEDGVKYQLEKPVQVDTHQVSVGKKYLHGNTGYAQSIVVNSNYALQKIDKDSESEVIEHICENILPKRKAKR